MTGFLDSRASQPSLAQVETLISFLETRVDLARGFGKSKAHRERAHKDWFRIGLKLNNMGGAVKTTQRWIKYWTDKKSAVKKKAALIEKSQNGDEEIPELSDIEERILALLKTPVNTSNSLLYKRLKQEPMEQHQNENSQNKILATYLLEDEMGEEEENADTTNEDTDDTFLAAYRFSDSNQSKHTEENNHTSHTPTVSSSRWGRLKLPPKPDPPPSQSNFFHVADKLCRIEQQRLDLDRRMVAVMERNSERDHMLAEAVKAMGEGLKALAEAVAKH